MLLEKIKQFIDLLMGVDRRQHPLKPYWHHAELDEMSKQELESLGRDYGRELDKRKTKEALIQELLDMCR
jgi:hypothetical protein|tara:strand:+ start:547 stop:756 length:210 start_codon:yes stop_codon:yes gene_type:complete